MVLPEIKNFIQAHKLSSFDLMDEHYKKAFTETKISELIQLSKNSDDLGILSAPQIKDKIEILRDLVQIDASLLKQAKTIPGELGKSYSGEIIAETSKEYIQQLGEKSNYFAFHQKNNLHKSLNIGDKIRIEYSRDASEKAGVDHIKESNIKSQSR